MIIGGFKFPGLSFKGSFRLGVFTILSLFVAFIILDVGFGWFLTTALTHPECIDPPSLVEQPLHEEHWLNTQDGISLRIWYFPSKNRAAIIILGGVKGSLGQLSTPTRLLLEEGYGVVQVDTRACAKPAAPVTLGGYELYDAEAALDFLLSRPEVTPNRIAAMGFSMGGAAAIRLTARHSEIQAVVRDGGFSNLGDLLVPSREKNIARKIFQSTLLYLFRIRTGIDPWSVSPIEDISVISPRPVLLIFGEHEAGAGLAQYDAAGNPKELWIVPGGHHGTNHIIAPDEYTNRLLAFMEQFLMKDKDD